MLTFAPVFELELNMKTIIILILTALTVSLQATAQDDGERPTSVPMQRVMPQEDKGDVVLVEGTVRDTQGNPLPGTAIRVRETKGGSMADEEGRFTLSVPRGKAVTVDKHDIICLSCVPYEDGWENCAYFDYKFTE